MGIRLVLLAVLALLPWQAGAQTILRSPASIEPAVICQLEPGQSGHPSGGSMAVCVWSVALEGSAQEPDVDRPASFWQRPGFGYQAGATLFVVGNVIAFSFPIWLAMGADAVTITSVIIAGELIEVAGIYLLGEKALRTIKGKLMAAVDHMRTRFDDWKSTSAETWASISPQRWN